MKGHIVKRIMKKTGKPKYYPVVYIGVDERGKDKYKWLSSYDTQKSAQQALTAAVRELDTGGFIEPTHEQFGDYIARWLEDKRAHLRKDTHRSYAWLVNLHIIPELGRYELSKLKPQHLQTFYTRAAQGDKPLSNRSIQFAHVIIHNALDRAVKWGLIARNIADMVEPPKVEKYHASVWTAEQSRIFLEKSGEKEPKYWIGFYLALLTGMREGEILSLQWSHIDWEQGFAHVQQTLKWIEGKPSLEPTKTDRSRRSVALSSDVLEALRWHKRRQNELRLAAEEYDDHDLILARLNGHPLHPKTFVDGFSRAVQFAEVPKIRFHDLRHTHASLLLQQGVHPKIVSERLGHSTISITLDTYSHVLPGLQKETAEQFAASLFGRK